MTAGAALRSRAAAQLAEVTTAEEATALLSSDADTLQRRLDGATAASLAFRSVSASEAAAVTIAEDETAVLRSDSAARPRRLEDVTAASLCGEHWGFFLVAWLELRSVLNSNLRLA